MTTEPPSPPVLTPGSDGASIRVRVRAVTLIGMVVNILLSILKAVLGVLGSSQALIADAVHSLSDLGTDVAVLVGVRYWSAPADEHHPYGHGRIEAVVTALIAVVLAAVGLAIGYKALATLQAEDISRPGWLAFGGAVVSIVSKEILYRWTVGRGRQMKSSAVVANAWHHRSDAFSSVPVALAVAGAAISPDWSFLDHIGAAVVAVFILRAAWRIFRPAFDQLVDRAASQKAREIIEGVARGTEGVREVHAVRARHIGAGLQVDLHILVDPQLTVQRGHDIAEAVKRNLCAGGPDVLDVVVHIEPCDRP